ncbi:hypothetical protein DQ04_06341030 [Trypanosoma grayi]|uniref:hypothetical protein n=1 Tax=Trypanosoma grayi TaxID=71804 RepID=UPI0004F46B4A|nr:hypothetical protein DQ04_06341030 [Trypanosoma grayi]KEG08838.1 hypothetical protein DQ04_06341030 [Trypanosoma grayi]
MPPKVVAADTDPMLQGTYLQDDTKDFGPSSEALDQFEAHLASGQPAHSGPSSKRQLLPMRRVSGAQRQGQNGNSNHQLNHEQQQQQLHRHGLKGANHQPPRGDHELTEEDQARLEDIEAVRHLGNDSDGDDE